MCINVSSSAFGTKLTNRWPKRTLKPLLVLLAVYWLSSDNSRGRYPSVALHSPERTISPRSVTMVGLDQVPIMAICIWEHSRGVHHFSCQRRSSERFHKLSTLFLLSKPSHLMLPIDLKLPDHRHDSVVHCQRLSVIWRSVCSAKAITSS